MCKLGKSQRRGGDGLEPVISYYFRGRDHLDLGRNHLLIKIRDTKSYARRNTDLNLFRDSVIKVLCVQEWERDLWVNQIWIIYLLSQLVIGIAHWREVSLEDNFLEDSIESPQSRTFSSVEKFNTSKSKSFVSNPQLIQAHNAYRNERRKTKPLMNTTKYHNY